MFQLVSCSFSTNPYMSLCNSKNFSIYLSPSFLYLLAENYERLYVFLTLHAPRIIMNAFLLSCVFSVENKMPGGYWSRTGTANLSGGLLHQKTVQCRNTLAMGQS